ncbi:MAG: hypothetical protein OEN56_13070 [Gemmatimonadota bacterium]|nr:hypothetical protein [Gemmatimonadota bacterium]
MTGRATTILTGRRERMERILDRALHAPTAGSDTPISDETRQHLLSEAEDLYWNEVEWEQITDEEALEDGPIVDMTFPGVLAYMRGLLLSEVMPDALAPANPRPLVVADFLGFLAERVVDLGDRREADEASESERIGRELEMASGLIDRVLYLYHDLSDAEIEVVEAAQASA